MGLLTVEIIAPDSAHWSRWIDDALGTDAERRAAARGFHQRLLDQGKIPFLSWHHLEELLGIESDANARARIAYLQSLPLIAWMRMPGAESGVGAVTDILAAEAIAVDRGCASPADVRDQVRGRLMQTGSGADAIGTEAWIWEVVRPELLARRSHSDMVAALAGFRSLDDGLTFGALAAKQRSSPAERDRTLARIRADVVRESLSADPARTIEEARVMGDMFVGRVLALMPPDEIGARDMMLATYEAQGIDPQEIHDDCKISDLARLGTFRSHLRLVAEKTDLPFERLKRVPMQQLPSWLITQALQTHGQKRALRPGSDVHDEHLAVLAAYTDRLYVDKRTHEDFRRALQKAPQIAALVGTISKAPRYGDLAESIST